MEKITHSFEAGRRGKPDELESIIATEIGATFLEFSKDARFDLRVCGGYNASKGRYTLRVSGEMSHHLLQQDEVYRSIRKAAVLSINRNNLLNLKEGELLMEYGLKPQSGALATNGAAGDSGNPIAVAVANAPLFLPWERYLAVHLRNIFDCIYHQNGKVPEDIASNSGVVHLPGLRSDGKIGVNASYYGGTINSIDKVTLAIEHEASLHVDELRDKAAKVALSEIACLGRKHNLYDAPTWTPEIIVNGRGAWNEGGWKVDEGSREAKPYRDGFSTHGCNEDSFSGEDPTKVSATGSFIARQIAVSIIRNGWAEYARVALDYTIGRDEVGLNISTAGTLSEGMAQEFIEAQVQNNIPLKINDGITRFNLRNLHIYHNIAQTADFFHNSQFPWNRAIHMRIQ